VALGLALAWEALVRVPLVLNAPVHLDSDLAVDGLTLQEATRGHWRWHYPGTPAIGTLPVLLSLPQALTWGANPGTLVSGGVVAYGLLTAAVFALSWRGFGRVVACWSLVPLAFASTGTLWLSGRITGGHLLTAAWHAGAFLLLYEWLVRGSAAWAAALGLFCGLGIYLDAMFIVTLAGLAPAFLAAWRAAGLPRPRLACGVICAVAFLVGSAPRSLGRVREPHDAYAETFRVVRDPYVLAAHARLLAQVCLPRLVVGHRLFDLQTDPNPLPVIGDRHPAAAGVTLVGLCLFPAALVALARPAGPVATRAVSLGLVLSAAAVTVGFVWSWNIYNSDNYRYLVTLLVPWAVGFGLLMQGLQRRGARGQAAAWLCAVLLASLSTVDTARWYARLGWIDSHGRPVRLPLYDPLLVWLNAHTDVTSITGDYWDVYRLAFLTRGRVRGVPLPVYPNRFPEWSLVEASRRDRVLLARPTRNGFAAIQSALAAGGRVVDQVPGVVIVSLGAR
jgi:hypothetical protein